MVDELLVDSKHGEVSVVGRVVSVKITPDRKVWVRWESKSSRFVSLGRKVPQGLSRVDKELWLVRYRNLILERFFAQGLSEKDVGLMARQAEASESSESSEVVDDSRVDASVDDSRFDASVDASVDSRDDLRGR